MSDIEPVESGHGIIFRNLPAALGNRLAGSYGDAVRYCVDRRKIHFFLPQNSAHRHKSVIHGITVPACIREHTQLLIRLDPIVCQSLLISFKTQSSDTLVILCCRQNQDFFMSKFT